MKKKMEYAPRFNFHNSEPICLIVDTDQTCEWSPEAVYYVSKRQARKIEEHFCGMSDCRCPKGEVVQLDAEGEHWGIPVANCE